MSKLSPHSTARGVAASVLERVLSGGAFAARALDAEISRAGLAARDARLATEIVYGTLRALPLLDEALDRWLTRGRPDVFTHAALRSAVYQARYLSRVPSFAIVQETVAVVKQKRGEGLARLANAVLRRVVAARPEVAGPAPWVLPPWAMRCLERGLGPDRLRAFIRPDAEAPGLCLRLRSGVDPAQVMQRIEALQPEAQLARSALSERVILARRAGDPRRLPGFAQGELAVQDLGAFLVACLVGAAPGERILDACAGRGGKTLPLLEAVGPEGAVTAVDVHERKLSQLAEAAAQLGSGAGQLQCEAVDLSVGDGGLPGEFDRVLVDAPCTGLGTARRRPEILVRLSPADPARMAALQLAILKRVVGQVRPGGLLVYVVCSGSAEEGIGVIEQFEAEVPRIRRIRNSVPGVPLTADDDGVFRLGPWVAAGAEMPDVYQVVRWEVLDSPSEAV